MIKVKIPQMTVMYPLNFNHPLVIGITMPGIDIRKVKKIKTAFPIAAVFSSASLLSEVYISSYHLKGMY